MNEEQIKAMLEDFLAKNDGALTAKNQEELFEQFGSSLAEELTKKWEDKFGKLESEFKTASADPSKPSHGFKGLGDFAQSVRHFGKEENQKRLKALSTSDSGEYLIPTEYANSIMKSIEEANPFFQLCNNVPISGNMVSLPYFKDKDHTDIYGGVVTYWTEEAGSVTASDMQFGKQDLRLHDIMGIIPATNDMIQDAPMAVDQMINSAFGTALGYKLEDTFINGNGVGKPLGLLNAPCTVSQAKSTSQTAATINSENLIAMRSRLPRMSKRNYIWIYGSDAEAQLINMKLGQSDFPAFIPAGMFRANQSVDTLLGRPVYESEFASAVGTVGDIIAVDPSQYRTITKGAWTGELASSMHLYFDTNKTAFRIVFRIDGAPAWETYETPASGSLTKSPIVTLAARA